MVFESSGVEEAVVDVVLQVSKSLGRCSGDGRGASSGTPGRLVLGVPHPRRGCPTHIGGTHAHPRGTHASARSNIIDSFGSNNSVMCRYYSISRFEAGSDGNGSLS